MIKLAIQKAIEGGWNGDNIMLNGALINPKHLSSKGTRHPADCFLDPLFWHCLGKSLGWKDIWEIEYRKESGYIETWERPEWHYWQYKFIDHLAENKDPGLFFEKLLK